MKFSEMEIIDTYRDDRTTGPTLRGALDVLNDVRALLSGRAWNATRGQPVRLAYHFAETGGLPGYYNSSASPSMWRDGFRPFDEVQRESARSALGAWAEVGGVRFEEVDDLACAQIVFGITDLGDGAVGYAFYPGAREGGAVWIDGDAAVEMGPEGRGYAALLHEIGHALGLRHPANQGNGNDKDWGGQGNGTVMSWRPGTGGAVPTEPGTLDIEALRYLYGEVSSAAVVVPVINDLPAQGAYSTPSNPYDLPVDGGWWISEIDWSGDVDYWRFYAREGYIYTLTADDDDVTSAVSPDIAVTGGSTGRSLTDAGYSVAEIRFTTFTDQWVTVSIRDWDFGSGDSDQDVGHYRIRVTSEPDPSVPIVQAPLFEFASWGTDSADHGEVVGLTAYFYQSTVTDHNVQFVVYEDSGGGVYDIWQTTIDASEDGFGAYASWTAVRRKAGVAETSSNWGTASMQAASWETGDS